MKKDAWDESTQDFYLNCLRNIVKTEDGTYNLQPVYKLVGDEILETEENKNNPTNNEHTKNCYVCIYHDTCDNCLIRTRLENLPYGYYVDKSFQNKCDAYTPIGSLNIISSKDEMIDFIEKVEHFFNSSEEYEWYFEFSRNYDEESDTYLETVREYYERGGVFKNIPDKYPVVIYFPYGDVSNDDYKYTDFQWIYIGGDK